MPRALATTSFIWNQVFKIVLSEVHQKGQQFSPQDSTARLKVPRPNGDFVLSSRLLAAGIAPGISDDRHTSTSALHLPNPSLF